MQDLELSPTGDLLFINHDVRLISGIDATAQQIAIRLQTILGEWYLERRAGIPYFENVFVKGAVPQEIESLLKAEITAPAEVISLDEFGINLDARQRILTVYFSAQTVWGALTNEVQL